MHLTPLPFQATLQQYRDQAAALLDAWRAGDPSALEIVRHKHPRFVNPAFPWLPKRLSDDEVRSEAFDLPDAQLTVARAYDYENWARLAEHVHGVTDEGSAVWLFESAVEAVVHGDLATLEPLLHAHPDLVLARSTRVTHFDPPVHGATLLHYIAANGVENYHQKTPPNAVAVATMLLRAGAAPDALAGMYGGQHTTMSMLVSSEHPARAGLQVPLIDTLADFGAAVNAEGSGDWASPLMTALAFGYIEAAEALVRRGARVQTLAAAAGLGRVGETRELLATAGPDDRHRALVLAAQQGHADIVRMLLDAGEDPNRYNPKGNHGHSTPLHQAVFAGHEAVVRLLVSRGARMDIKDTIHESTPLGWAVYGGRNDIAEYLRTQGAGAR
jgi:ankyrin repeat protein